MLSVRMTGVVDEPLSPLSSPVCRTDPRCGPRQMSEGVLDQRHSRIIAAAIEQVFQREQANLHRESPLLGSEVPGGAHQS